MVADGAWQSEEEYLHHLEDERRLYAWVMQTYGRMSGTQAREAAERRYPYEPVDAPYRGLIFHDEAWHWAMLELKGACYLLHHPESANPPETYRALDLS